ncbi:MULTISPECIES: hypothetical protein [Methylosinus]|uniref:hypothetical protein n=1 Tax=Methylosinus TaxID=425 RepID=UPI0012DC0E9F|nr:MULTISPECIES: hypothetical protein [Methylosinus]
MGNDSIIGWIGENHVGDLASIAGVGISVIGFMVTVYDVRRSRKAAELAQQAAQDAKNSIQIFETVVDLSAAIQMLEEVKRAHRNRQWEALPDRYANLRKTLISIRRSSDLSDEHASVFQAAIANLRDMEQAVEKSLPNMPQGSHHRFNELLSKDVDELAGVLAELKFSEIGA